jgi:multidrug efflux pump subunit AcrA (membrane-fusion protein)
MREVPLSTSTYDTLTERMSPLPLDSPFVQQTKDRIREIVAQITKMSQSVIEPSDFWDFALPRILEAMGGDGAAVWAWQPNQGWSLVANTRMPGQLFEVDTLGAAGSNVAEASDSSFDRIEGIEKQLSAALLESESPNSVDLATRASNAGIQSFQSWIPARLPSETHLLLLDEVRKEHQPVLIPPQSASLVKGRPANPTESLMMLVPFPIALDGGQLWLELLQKPSGGPSSQRGYLRFAAQMADVLAEYLRSYRLRTLERDQEFMRRSYATIELAASAPDIDRGLSKLVSEIRNTADAEHAILFRRNGGRQRWRVTAIAGLTKVDRRADGVHLLEDSAPHLDLQLKHGASLHRDYTRIDQQQEASLPAEMQRWKETFSVTRCMWIKPLLVDVSNTSGTSTLLETVLQPRGVALAENAEPRAHDTAILLTWSGQGIPPVRCVEQSALTLKLGLSILRPRWWQSHVIRDARLYSAPSVAGTSRKWVAAVILSLMVAAVMAIPVPIQIESTATLRPSKASEMFASANGTIEKVFVKDGQFVQKGEPLLSIASPELSQDHEQAIANRLRSKQRFDELGRKVHDQALTSSERDSIAFEQKKLEEIQKSDENRITLLQQQIDRLTILAPASGTIEARQVQDYLKQPVPKGKWLLSLRNEDSQWELEAKIPERYLQELRNASQNESTSAIARMTALPTQPLRLRVSDPITWRPVETGVPSATGTLDNREYRVRFALEDPLPTTVASTGASARIAITTGRGPLIWALSKDFIEDIGARTAMWLR